MLTRLHSGELLEGLNDVKKSLFPNSRLVIFVVIAIASAAGVSSGFTSTASAVIFVLIYFGFVVINTLEGIFDQLVRLRYELACGRESAEKIGEVISDKFDAMGDVANTEA